MAHGAWRIRVTLPGFGDVLTPVRRVEPGESCDFGDLVLRRGGSVVVQFSTESGVDATGAFAHLSAGDGRFEWMSVEKGVANSGLVAPGRYVLVCGGKFAATTTREIEVLPAEELAIDVTLRAGVSTRVSVADDGGLPLDVKVRLEIANALGHRFVELSLDPAKGRENWTAPLLAGRYRATAHDDRGRSGTLDFEIGPTATAEVVEQVVRIR